MFGELDDSDIYVNNQNDNFDEPLISEFAEDDVLANDTPADGPEVNDECANPQEKPKTDNSKLLIYVLVLILLVAGAAGAYFYKMKASQQDEIAVVGQETSEMGDFFYDKAKADGAAEETTVVDVELAAPAEQKAENAAAPAPGAKTEQKAEEKEFSPAAAVKEQAKKELEKKNKYETVMLESKRLIIDKGDSKSSKSVYEYDLTKCTNIGGVNKLVKFKEPVNFVGNDPVKYYEECKKNKMFDWYVFLKSDNTCTSNVILEEKEDDALEISYNTNPKYWGNNYVVEATLEIIKYLKKLGYKKIIAHVFEGNIKSIRVLEKLGFKYIKKELSFYKPLNKYIGDYEYQLDI